MLKTKEELIIQIIQQEFKETPAMKTAVRLDNLGITEAEVIAVWNSIKIPEPCIIDVANRLRDLSRKKDIRPLIGEYYILDTNPEFDDYAGLKILVEKGPRNKNTRYEQYRVRYGDDAFEADWIDVELFTNAKLTTKDDPYIQPEIIP
jgi:hypothetical protein